MTSKSQPFSPIVPKEDSMIRSQAQRVSAYEVEVREFAAQYPTPTVREALGHAESGRLTWEQVHGLFESALRAALDEVTA